MNITLCNRTNKWDEGSSLDITVCKRVNKQDEGGMLDIIMCNKGLTSRTRELGCEECVVTQCGKKIF